MRRLRRILSDRRGTSAVEYGLICALIIIAMLTSLRVVAGAIITKWNVVSTQSTAVL